MPTDDAAREIAERLALSTDDLHVVLTTEVVSSLGGLDRRRRREIGEAWWNEHLGRIRETICTREDLPRLQAVVDRDSTALASAIADLLAPVLGTPPAFTAAVLAVRYGLTRLCGGVTG